MQYRGLDRLTPQFRQKVELWMGDNPDVFFITESWRSFARQLWYYASGRSRPGPVITWTLKSRHQLGQAVDIAFRGEEMYPKYWAKWREVADSAKKYGILWGYDLWKVDKPHFEDDGEPLNPSIMPIPEWAEKTVETMEKAEIKTDPNTTIGEMRLYHLLAVVGKFVAALLVHWEILKNIKK